MSEDFGPTFITITDDDGNEIPNTYTEIQALAFKNSQIKKGPRYARAFSSFLRLCETENDSFICLASSSGDWAL